MTLVRKALVAGLGIALASATAAAASNPKSNGAQRSGLSPRAGDSNGQCYTGSGAGTNGFTIFNAPGKPGATIKFNGEVSLKRGAADTAYKVFLVPSGGDCSVPAAMIMTNGQGNGNAHLAKPGTGAGTYYVVLQDAAGNEQFASKAVTIK